MKIALFSKTKTLIVGLILTTTTLASAQLREQEEVVTAVAAGNWKEALAITSRVVERYDSRAKVLWGPKFGWYWYQKGLCEIKLERWKAAASSFQHCYDRYPNPQGGLGAAPAREQNVNAFRVAALKGWADAEFGLKNFEASATLYRKYLVEKAAED